MIKAILFDLDGTLVNTNELIIKTYKYTLKEHLGIEATREEIVQTFGEPLYDCLAKYDKHNADKLVETYRKYNESIHDDLIEGFIGVEEGLKILKDMGMKIVVVTSKRKSMAIRGLKVMNLLDYMDDVVGPEDTIEHKPLGMPALRACEILNIKPDEAIMVGDSHNDILCGKNAGCKTCLVKYTALPLAGLMKFEPDYLIDDIREIAQYVEMKIS